MAEYVRRKRPPADHPYWGYLHDRAHPPSVVWPVAIPTAAGLGIGLTAGLNDHLPVSAAVANAASVATVLAVAVAICSIIPLVLTARRQTRRWEALGNAALTLIGIGFVGFGFLFVPLSLVLLWYSVSGGSGPWVGMLIGSAVGIGPGVLFAWAGRRRWTERLRRWPRWPTPRRRSRRRAEAEQPPVQPAPLPIPDVARPSPTADDNPSMAAG